MSGSRARRASRRFGSTREVARSSCNGTRPTRTRISRTRTPQARTPGKTTPNSARSVSGDLEIRPFASPAEADACARMMSATDPWKSLRRDHAQCLRMLQDVNRERYAALHHGELAGFLVLNMRGAFAGYLQTICVDEAHRSRGLGTRLIGFAEEGIFRE